MKKLKGIEKLGEHMNSFPKSSSPFGKGVKEFIQTEEKLDVIQTYNENIKSGHVYRHQKVNFVNTPTETKTFMPKEVWRINNMKEFMFVAECRKRGLADVDGQLIIKGSITTTVRHMIIICLSDLHRVFLMMNNKIKPKNTMRSVEGGFFFRVGDLVNFISYHFPDDLALIKKANKSDILKSIHKNIEMNQVRKRKPLGIFKVVPVGGLNEYWMDKVISLFTPEQLELILSNSLKSPHYTKVQYNQMIKSLGLTFQGPITQKINPEEPKTPSHDDSALENRVVDRVVKVMLAAKANIKTIDINAFIDNMPAGDSAEISVKYTKASGE